MNFAPDDVHRSLRRFVVSVLGSPPWSVRTEREVIADDARPACVVETSSPVVDVGKPRVTIPQGDVTKMQSFAVQAYPELFDTAREGRQEAQRVASLLDDAFTFGLVDDDELSICPPDRMPVYDYADVPVIGPDRAGPDDPYGFAWVEEHPTQPLQDPLDAKRWTVVVTVRLSWQRGGRLPPEAPAVASIPGTGTVH